MLICIVFIQISRLKYAYFNLFYTNKRKSAIFHAYFYKPYDSLACFMVFSPTT